MEDYKEKRKHKRYKVVIPIDCCGRRFLQSKFSFDLSLQGIFIQTDLLEAPGTIIELSFIFAKDGERMKVLGKVVWAGKKSTDINSENKEISGIGLEFIHPPAEFIDKIKELYLK